MSSVNFFLFHINFKLIIFLAFGRFLLSEIKFEIVYSALKISSKFAKILPEILMKFVSHINSYLRDKTLSV